MLSAINMIYTKLFSEIGKDDVAAAGGKGASLGEMTQTGIPVPNGYVLLSGAFERFLEETDLQTEIHSILHKVNKDETRSVEHASEKIQQLILTAKLPADLALEITEQFNQLGVEYVAVRSSATAEDSASAAWAGQLDSYLNTTADTLLSNVQRCWASLFTPRAIFYRFEKDLQTTKISVAVVVQKMVASEMSGVAFSVHPVTEDRNQLIIEAVYGLGESLVSGQITPDSYVVSKDPRQIVDRTTKTQTQGLYRAENGGNEWRPIAEPQASAPVLSDEQILSLSELVIRIEKQYGFPCDVEWAFETGTFCVVQTRPITTLSVSRPVKSVLDENHLSLSEWFADAEVGDGNLFRNEDNEKRERLKVLHRILDLPFDAPTQFEASDVADKTPLFKAFLTEHGHELCALRLIPTQAGLPKLRMRGLTVSEVTETWFPKQIIDTSQYRADFVPHSNETIWSTICVVNQLGIFGEMIRGGHDQLTSGNYAGNSERHQFSFNFQTKQWQISPQSKEALAHIEEVASHLKVPDPENRSELTAALSSTFHNDYLAGYFESVLSTEFGLWFIDYNRILGDLYGSMSLPTETNHEGDSLKGTVVYGSGKIRGTVAILGSDPDHVPNLDHISNPIIVAPYTLPQYLTLLKKATAVITNEGGLLSHASIISRELKKPCLIGTKVATNVLHDGDLVEIDTAQGTVKVLVDTEL